jgi:hypothetical protein
MRFWQGLFWGSFIVILIGTIFRPIISKSRRKPLVERGADAVLSTTHGLMRQARKRLVHKFD